MKIFLPNIMKLFVPLAFVMTVSAGMVYVAVQQNFRMSADDPQIQLAEDFSVQLSAGRTISSVNVGTGIDMAKSLSPFIFIYDESGNILVGSGKIDNQYPALPNGVLEEAKVSGRGRITWEPQSGLRFATVITPYSGTQSGFVVIGRSLREIEQRTDALGLQVLIGWIIGLIGLFVIIVGGKFFLSRQLS